METIMAALGLALAGAAGAETDAGAVSRTYDVRDLLRPVPSEARTIETRGRLLMESPDQEFRPPAAIRDAGERHEIDPTGGMSFGAEEEGRAAQAAALSGVILGVLRPEDPEAIRMIEDRGELLVTAPLPIHARVAALLSELRARRAARILIECLFVPAEMLRAAAPGRGQNSHLLDGAAFVKLLADPRARLATAFARNGQTIGFGVEERRGFVSDYEVNCTGVLPALNPSTETLSSGDRAEVTAWIEGDRIRVDLGMRTARVDGAKESFSEEFGELELPRVRESLLWTSAILPPSGAVVAAIIQGGGEAKEDVAFIVRGRRTDGARMAEEASKVFADIPIALRLPFERAILAPGLCEARGDEEEGDDVVARLRETIRAERDRLAPDLPLHPDEILFLPDGTGFIQPEDARARGFIERALGSIPRPRMVRVDLRLIAVSRAAFAGLGEWVEEEMLLKQGWEKAINVDAELMRIVACGLEGQVISVRRAKAESIVADVESLSGGTSFALFEVHDPIVVEVASGIALEVRATQAQAPAQGRFHLEVLGLKTETDTSRKHKAGTLKYEGLGISIAPGVEEKGTRLMHGTMKLSEADLVVPSQTISTWKVDADLPPAQEAILDVSAREGGDVIILVGSVRIAEP